MRRAVYSIKVDGKTVTDAFEPLLISMHIRLADGGKSDTLEINLDDTDGQIQLPREDADIEATLAWSDGGGSVHFTGKTDEPKSQGSRGGGMVMSIHAHATDMKGEPKAKQSRHKGEKDKKTKFGEVAKDWGKKAGLDVKVEGKLESVEREYWSMANESYMAWGQRMAEDLGATFKISGKKAVFVPRNSGKSASGKPLTPITATYGENIIDWDLSPTYNRARYKDSIVRWYDLKKAKWNRKKVTIEDQAKVHLVDTVKASSEDHAKDKAEANAEESKRGKGGGTITIDGDPAAQPQAPCTVKGIRGGIDGQYQITTATHNLTRGQGWTVDCDLEQPQSPAGQDSRKAAK